MAPEVAGISTYYSAWVIAASVFVFAGSQTLVSKDVPLPRCILFLLCLVFTVVAGAKVAYLLEQRFSPVVAPFHARGVLSGFRLPGGLLLAALCFPALTRAFRLEPAFTADRLLLPAWSAVAVVHLGCFLNGCCFGNQSALPWAVRLEQSTVTYALHRKPGWLSAGQNLSAAVHPLPLYFAFLALLAAALLRLSGKIFSAPPGCTFWGSVLFYGLGSVFLERLRPVPLWVNVPADIALVAIAPVSALWCMLGSIIATVEQRTCSPP